MERVAECVGRPPHGLSQAQLKLPRPRLASQLGQAAGVIFGCIVGMFPLLLLDTEKATKLKQSSSQEALFKAIVHECSALLHAESATLWMVDRSGAGANVGAFAVWGRTEEERDVSVPTHSAPAVGYVVRSGAGVSVGDVATHPLCAAPTARRRCPTPPPPASSRCSASPSSRPTARCRRCCRW